MNKSKYNKFYFGSNLLDDNEYELLIKSMINSTNINN